MKFYLSSYEIGNDPDQFANLIGGQKRIGVIRNALDFSTDQERLAKGKEKEFKSLKALGFKPTEIDLRKYFGKREQLKTGISQLDGLWVVGGNAFLLNYAFKKSGLDEILVSMLSNNEFVYAGYSAGICVLAPSLHGIHLVDDPNVKAYGYPDTLPWESLGILPFSMAPHWRSDHPESELIEKTIAYFMEEKIPFIALRDGETFICSVDNTLRLMQAASG